LAYPHAIGVAGHTVAYAPSAAGRVLSALDSGSGINYAQSATYAPQGGLKTLTLGAATGFSGIAVSNDYNSRLQPLYLTASSSAGTVLSLSYNFNWGNADNGNVMSIANNRDTTRSAVYTYDDLNRLLTAQTNSATWGNSYVYDA